MNCDVISIIYLRNEHLYISATLLKVLSHLTPNASNNPGYANEISTFLYSRGGVGASAPCPTGAHVPKPENACVTCAPLVHKSWVRH